MATYETDYSKFLGAATQSKQAVELEKWFVKAKEQVYIDIKDTDCKQALEFWKQSPK